MFKPLPFLTDEELQSILERTTRNSSGCLILAPERPGGDPTVVNVQEQRCAVLRLIWAENFGEAGLSDHQVIHIAECPNTACDHGSTAFCIEPSHLALGDARTRAAMQSVRGTVRRCPHGNTERSASGHCKICERMRYRKQGASA